MANIARFHRKKIPTKKNLKSIQLDNESKHIVVVLSTLVRLAEKLDRSHCGLVKKAEFLQSGKNLVTLSFTAGSDCSLEEWSIQQNKKAFSESFGKELEVKCIVLTDST